MAQCHDTASPDAGQLRTGTPRIALVGSPNSGKTSIFNGLTGLRARTGNYPGVTVSRYTGTCRAGERSYLIEDLPGTYSLEPISPDEQIVADVLGGSLEDVPRPDALLVVVDATTLRRSLSLVAQVLGQGLPACLVVTFTDELASRQGWVDLAALEQAVGVPVLRVVGNRGEGLSALREHLADWQNWSVPPIAPPVDPGERDAWVESVLAFAGYRAAQQHRVTARLDAVLLHPLWGTLVFFAVMMAFFQTVFTVAAPLQGLVESFFGRLAGLVATHVADPWVSGLLGDAVIGGVGGVLVFVPQIALLFLLVALLEGLGYMSRAAFLMDRVMAKAGLEGRAFVALLSSFACAVPGIMATRTLPSARDRLATMMGAPLMTCSARLPVYILLIGLLVDPSARFGPFGAQGTIMFALYLLGAVSAMTAAWVVKRIGSRNGLLLPFYMEMPPYRIPSARSVLVAMWDSSKAFVRKCSTIILATTVLLWLLLNLPVQSGAQSAADHSYAAAVGRFVSPVFEPLGFDWRVNVAVLSAQSARETFVATIGQVAAAENAEDPSEAMRAMTYTDGPRAGQQVFTPPTIAALLVYFAYALQCMATVGVMRRETGTWRWPAIAFLSYTGVAWVMALLARTVVAALAG